MINDPAFQRRAQAEVARRVAGERGRYYTPNGGIERFLDMIQREVLPADNLIHIVILRAGNGLGKTALAANLAAYLSNRYSNPYFDKIDCLKNYRRPNRGRILTTANAASTAYDEELQKWLPSKRYRSHKNGHKFQQYYEMFGDGSQFDILTFDQDPMQGESVTLDWAIIDEPMPRKHWSALKSRFRFGGVIFMLFTALEGAGWYKHQLEDDDRLGRDVHVMELSSEENCKEHGIRGLMPHAALESMWADFDEAELPARRDGKYLASSGIIFPTYRDENWVDAKGEIVGHVMEELSGYHRECFDAGYFTLACVIDPHDRKPFAVSWDLTFPNEDNVVIAEWPDDTIKMFHKLKSCAWSTEKYARMIKATEGMINGAPAGVRIMDPNFGNAPKATSKSTIADEFRLVGRQMNWSLDFNTRVNDEIDEGHIAIKNLLGDPARGVRPKQFVMAHCKNTRFAFKNYSYKEHREDTKGLSEKPELQYKDFMDLRRYRAMAGIKYIKRVDLNDPAVAAAELQRKTLYRPRRIKSTGFVGMAG